MLQFAVHFCSLVYLVREATSRSPVRKEQFVDLESEFKPSLLNSTVYVISISLQVSTFAVNYKVSNSMKLINVHIILKGNNEIDFNILLFLLKGTSVYGKFERKQTIAMEYHWLNFGNFSIDYWSIT